MKYFATRRKIALFWGFAALVGIPTANAGVGQVAVIEGNAFAQKGEIFFTRPKVGESVRVNQFGQYKDVPPDPAYVKYEQNTRRHLKPNDSIEEGDIIQTMGDAWLKVLFSDNSVVDFGPGTVAQAQKFQGTGPNRTVLFKVLYGKIRDVVSQPLSGPTRYQVLTPTTMMGVRGTEFIVNVQPDKEHRVQTEIVCLHGQVSVDVTKFDARGLVYTQPMVVNPGSYFATSGVHGLGQQTTLKMLPQSSLRAMVAKVSPAVNTRATLVGTNPPPNRLPGTGVRMQMYAEHEPRRVRPGNANSFDSEHPPQNRMIASASGNFEIPHNYLEDDGSAKRFRDVRTVTGPPPAQFLPATTSRVRINLIGIQ